MPLSPMGRRVVLRSHSTSAQVRRAGYSESGGRGFGAFDMASRGLKRAVMSRSRRL